MEKILVTGSSGTIGTRLCEKLLERGDSVYGIDKVENKWNSKVQKITSLVDLIKDFKSDCNTKISNVYTVIHLAANARVYDLVVSPELAMENIQMLFNILEMCRKGGVKKFIFASSREVYGNSDKDKYKETDQQVDNCESPYTASKIAGEALVRSYCQCYGIDFIIFRFSNVYGMYDDSDRVIPLFIRNCKENKDLIVFGQDKSLDFTYIDDTVNGIMLGMDSFDQVKNNVYNISSGKATSILEVAKMIREMTNANVKIEVSNSRTGEIIKYIGDYSKADIWFDYDPIVDIKEGLKKTINWYKND